MTKPAAADVVTLARAVLVGHQTDAIPYLDMRIASMTEAEEDEDVDYWSLVWTEAKRQIEAGERRPAV